MGAAEKGGEAWLGVLGKVERIEFYLDGLDRVVEVEPIVTQILNRSVNFGMGFLLQQEVSRKLS